VWWPAATLLVALSLATSVMFWSMLRRWGGSTPATAAAAVLFAAWPATLVAQRWLSAGLETVPLLLMFIAGYLLARPRAWTPWAVGALAAGAWAFHERAVYFVPVLLAVALMYTGRRAWRDNRTSWWTMAGVTGAVSALRWGDALPGRDGGTSIPGAAWQAGPGSLLRSVLGWLPYSRHGLVPDGVGLWALIVLAVWTGLFLAGVALWPRRTLLVTGVVAGFLAVEVLSFVWLRGGAAGSVLASDPRFTLVTGVVLLAGLGALPVTWRAAPALAIPLVVLGCWSMWRIGTSEVPGRQWLAAARDLPPGSDLAATPSPPAMLAHFFFTPDPPVYELGTTRTLLQVGADPARFPEVAADPLQVVEDGQAVPLTFTALLVDERRQCGPVEVPQLRAGVRVVRVTTDGPGRIGEVGFTRVVHLFPPPGPVATVALDGACATRVEVGVPGR
jgi:hypothetical protein